MHLLSLLPLLVVRVLCDGPVTIDQSDAYKQQRKCAFRCFVDFSDVGYPIAMQISCPTFRVQNDCFCRSDLQQEANLYVSSCVDSGCSRNKFDIDLATKIYDDYCTRNGYERPAQVTTPPGTGAYAATITALPTTTVGRTTTATDGTADVPSRRPIGWVSFASSCHILAVILGILNLLGSANMGVNAQGLRRLRPQQ